MKWRWILAAMLMAALIVSIFALVFALGDWRALTKFEIYVGREEQAVEAPRGMPISYEVQERVAIHEAGHAVVRELLVPDTVFEEIRVYTEVKNGWYGHTKPEARAQLNTFDDIMDNVVFSMGGRAAEELILGAPTTGAAGDLSQSTQMVRSACLRSGLCGRLVSFGEDEPLAHEMEYLVEDILTDGYARASAIVRANADVVSALACLVLSRQEDDEERELSGEDIRAFFEATPLVDPFLSP